MQKIFTVIGMLLLFTGLAFADEYFEGATNGTLDLEWTFNTTTHTTGDTLVVVDSTGSAWGSHVLAYTDAGYTGLVHLKDVMLSSYTIQADIYIVGEAVADFPLYAGIGIRMAHDETKFYRLVFRNSSSSDHGQLKLQGFDGANWHISQSWNAGTDFDSLRTGWHNFKIKVSGNKFWAYMDGEMLPGCPFEDDSPFLEEGYPGIYKYNTASGTVLFDNFKVQTPDLFFSEYIEGSSNNKAWEIYNPTDAAVDLADYQILQSVNGGGWQYAHIFPTGATLDAGDVWVICTNQTDVALFDTLKADEVLSYPSVTHHNGDDARALIKIMGTDTLWLDIFGDPDNDPGTAWDVAGVSNGTKDHTLVRKEAVFMGEIDWMASFGTDTDNSEWVVYDQNTFDYLGAHPGMPGPEVVNVTFIANTATVPDTLGPTSVVQIRGSGGPLTWDGGSPAIMQNVGGDYWTTTLEFEPGATIEFKFYTNAHNTVAPGVEWEHQGWEGDVSGGIGTNRGLTVGNSDTTLPVQFVNGWKFGADQYEAPYTTNDSSFVVWVRVNCQGWEDFNPDAQQIGIRGSNNVDWGDTGELSWNKTHLLNQESDHANGGSQQYSGRYFYSGAVHVPNQYANDAIEFKVVVHNAGAPLDEDWGNMVYNPGLQTHVDLSGVDTTNYWFWFDNLKPTVVQHGDVVVVEFVADMKNAIDGKGFAFGDTLQVRSGYYGTASEIRIKMMKRQGFSTLYSAKDTVQTTIGANLDYQFYKIKNGVEYREIYYNFLYTGDTAGEAERRVVESVAGSDIKVEDILDSKSEVHRMPVFRNTAVLAQDVLVTFTCDVRPAIYQVMVGDTLYDIQGNVNIGDPAQILQLGVAMNGPATGGWGTWGPNLMTDEARMMYDDGTNGDAVAGDSIYTIQIQYAKDSLDVVGQEFKFGIGGGDNEGGYGNNHIENIDDTNPTFTVNGQFGSIDPVFYYTWDFDLRQPTDVQQVDLPFVPDQFSLEQNYPNPFNPTTEIIYTLPKETEVTLTIYNTIGQKIVTLVSEKQAAGKYRVRWSGLDNSGMYLPTGMYFYRLDAGEFTSTKKMLMVK